MYWSWKCGPCRSQNHTDWNPEANDDIPLKQKKKVLSKKQAQRWFGGWGLWRDTGMAMWSQWAERPWWARGKHTGVWTKSFVPLFLFLFPGPVRAHSFDQCLKACNSAKHCICQITVEGLQGHNQLHSPTEPSSKSSASSERWSSVKFLSTDLHLYF